MIQKYEGFLSNLFKKKPVEPVKNPLIRDEKLVELGNDSFIELVDYGYTIKIRNKSWDDPYVQITKHLRSREDSPYKFIDVKDYVLSFYDRLKDYGDININFAFVYENDKGGLSCDYPKYEDFEKGDYDNREVSILTIYIKD